MSIVGRRKRRLVLAWFMGVLTATLVAVSLVLFSVLDITEFIQLNKEKMTKNHVEEVAQVIAARPIEAGTILDEDDFIEVLRPVDYAIGNGMSLSELVGLETRIDIDDALPITPPMVVTPGQIDDQERLFEVDYVRLPLTLNVGDVIDVRIMFPNGQDYVVLAKKEVIQYERDPESIHTGLLSLMIEEGEVLRMSSALVDVTLTETAELYTVKYVDPLNQEAAHISYPVNRSVMSVLEGNPNLKAMPDIAALTMNRSLLDRALKELLDEDDEWFSIFNVQASEKVTIEDKVSESVNRDHVSIVESDQDINEFEDKTTEEKHSISEAVKGTTEDKKGPSNIAGF